jgi:hypothetical protein
VAHNKMPFRNFWMSSISEHETRINNGVRIRSTTPVKSTEVRFPVFNASQRSSQNCGRIKRSSIRRPTLQRLRSHGVLLSLVFVVCVCILLMWAIHHPKRFTRVSCRTASCRFKRSFVAKTLMVTLIVFVKATTFP